MPAVYILIAIAILYLIKELSNKRELSNKKNYDEFQNAIDVKDNLQASEDELSLKDRRIEYLKQIESEESLKPGLKRFEEIVIKLTEDNETINKIEEGLMKTHATYHFCLCRTKTLEVGVSARASYRIQHKQTITVLPTAHSLYGYSSYMLNTIFS